MNTLPDRDEPNPFAPPESGFQSLGGRIDSAWTGDLNVEDVVRTSWGLLRLRPGKVIGFVWGVMVLNWLMQLGLRSLPRMLEPVVRDPITIQLASFTASIASMILSTWLSIGLYRAMLKLVRGEPVEFAEVTRGGPYLLTVILGWVVICLMIALPATVIGGTVAVIVNASEPPLGIILGLGLLSLAAVVFMFYLFLRLSYFMLVCLDHDTGVMDSLRGSWQATRGNVANLILIGMVQVAINLMGFLFLCVGLIVTLPLTQLVYIVTYNTLSGWRAGSKEAEPKMTSDTDWV